MKRKIISTVLIAGMVMTGCAATGTPEATTASTTETATAAAGETTAAAETGEETQADGAEAGGDLKDGSYDITVDGRNGKMTVTTVIKDGAIAEVTIGDNTETPEVATTALEQLPKAIVDAGTPFVDAVTGATITSDAIMEAVKGAITAAGGNPDSFSKDTGANKSTEVKELEADVVVVGAGATGVSAALTAQQNGANVILLEKAATPGGVSIIAGGPMGIDSKDQQEAGVAGTFTTADVLKYWQDYNCWMDDGQLFYNISNRSGETIDWLEENGMEFTFMGTEQAAHADGFQTYHIYKDQENKAGYYTTLIDKFTEAGGQVYFETPATELKAENDAITGVIATAKDGTTYDISCKAVVLGTGGFGANAEMIEEEVGFPLETFTTGTQTGDGATMSRAIGAGKGKTIQQYHGVTSYSGIQTGQGKDEIAKAIYMPTSVWVNRRAARFCPEDLNYDTALCSNAAATQGEYFYSIISEDMVKALEEGGAKALDVDTAVAYEPTIPMFSIDEGWTEFRAALEDGVSKGIVFKGANVSELAANMGIDAETLEKTLADYNASCENGVDPVYGKASKYLKSLGDGTLYAVKARPVSLGGIGGVLVNSNLQVIKDDGTVIKGLYAAGNDVAEMFNNSYPLVEGVTMMNALSGGRICGEEAANYAKG
ncbi:fumarate reductase flavoprotein subunit [Oribacterium sp. KHPX15]|uniref:FAD-dependent oxidoreductase n=1 Tax=Oribacterium sp. KHPX15 TaxID=1855342 RepID=UPI000897B5AE|nr:FAD-dependent oxidoreductase [Oribacterium sp. KHPX15]SEA63586.1 fumarate reductase flavoprotein subunit [Oribacterium sp. KHPX15]